MIKTLYKTDSKGNMRFLTIFTDGSTLTQKSGIVGTDNPIVHSKVCKGKNIGKANETSPEQQAEVEANNMYSKKLREDYSATEKGAVMNEKLFPMLAKVYEKESHKIDWSKPVFTQRKLDGMRCLAQTKDGVTTMYSRDGKEITTLPHILEAVSELAQGRDITFDGELYAHGLTFQENMRLIKKNRPESIDVHYHIYDIVREESIDERLNYLFFYLSKMNPPLELVETFLLEDEEHLERLHLNFLSEGYEGSMVRYGKEGYKLNGRSSNLLKRKDFDDAVLELIDVVEGEQRPEWGTPVFNFNGKRNEAGCRLSHKEREDLLTNKHKYIGRKCEVRYFGETEDGLMRIPVLVGYRLDK